MNRKVINITQTGLIAKTMNGELNTNVIYKVRGFYRGSWFAVATSESWTEEFDTELEARMVSA